MQIKPLKPASFVHAKSKLFHFLHQYSEGRITKQSLSILSKLGSEGIAEQPGTELWVALEDKRLAGISFLADYGRRASILVVSPSFRGRGVGRRLLQSHIHSLKTIYCQVAEDNLACMNACIQAGLRPVKFTTGPTGKPTLVFSNERKAFKWQHQQ